MDLLLWLSCVGLVVALCFFAILCLGFRILFGFHIWDKKEMQELRDILYDD